MEEMARDIAELKARYGNRFFFNFAEAAEILELKRDALYDLLAAGKLVAHSCDRTPGKKGVRIVASSVWSYLMNGIIPADHWAK